MIWETFLHENERSWPFHHLLPSSKTSFSFLTSVPEWFAPRTWCMIPAFSPIYVLVQPSNFLKNRSLSSCLTDTDSLNAHQQKNSWQTIFFWDGSGWWSSGNRGFIEVVNFVLLKKNWILPSEWCQCSMIRFICARRMSFDTQRVFRCSWLFLLQKQNIFHVRRTFLSIEFLQILKLTCLFLFIQTKKRLIQPNVKRRNVDFIVSFGLLDEQMQLTLPRLLGVVFPRICLAFYPSAFFSSACRSSREQASLANSVNRIFCRDLAGTVRGHRCAVLCLLSDSPLVQAEREQC